MKPLVLLLVIWPAAASAAPDALTSQRAARAQLDAALAAHGGAERIEALGPLTITFKGRRWMIGQSRSAVPPWAPEPLTAITSLDPAKNRVAQESSNDFPGGFLLRYRTVVTADGGWNINLDRNFEGAGIDRTVDPTGTRAWLARELPPLMLLHARERAASLRSLGDGLVSYTEPDGTLITMRFDPQSKVLVGYETVNDNVLLGDDLTSIAWSGWRDVRGVRVPSQVREQRGGAVAREGTLTVEAGPVVEERFTLPPGFVDSPPLEVGVKKLAPGVAAIRQADGNTVLAVELGDGVFVSEAPWGSALTESTIERIAAEVSPKPIRTVTFTHPHNDHSAGLRPYIARGATLLVAEAHKGYVERIAAAPHTIAPDKLALAPRAPIISTFTGEKTLTGGGRTIRLFAIGPTSHSEDTVVVYLPAEHILYQGDHLVIPDPGAVAPGQDLTYALDRLIREKKLVVDVIIGTHGHPGTMADLREAIRLADLARKARAGNP